jgi:hypothetical protein
MKRRSLFFEPVSEPIRTLTTKFGGQPVWAQEPELFGGPAGRIAYLFMTAVEVVVAQNLPTYDADSGENAVVIQQRQDHGAWTVSDGPVVQQYIWDPGALRPAKAILQEEEEPDGDEELDNKSKIGGRPWWLQADETPGEGWRLLLQMYEPGDTDMGILSYAAKPVLSRFVQSSIFMPQQLT